MPHYILKIIDNPTPEDPVKNALDVHKHFTRYSKGQFDGPIIKVSKTKAKISVWGSYEMEDEILRIALDVCNDEELTISGTIISPGDFSKFVKEEGLGSEWIPKKSTGKTSNYNSQLKAVKVEKEKLKKWANNYTKYVYNLITFTADNGAVKLTTKKKPPRPNSKNPEDSNPATRLKFCTLKIPNTPENLERVIEGFFKDVKDEIPAKWKTIVGKHTINITDLILPPKEEARNSRLFRLKTLRKGFIVRTITIDGNDIVKEIPFTV